MDWMGLNDRMIVDPDFLDHWKTLLLIEALDGEEVAPLYVLRLWAHCQNRRQWIFSNLSEVALKALCRYPGHPKKLVTALTTSGFISISDCGEIVVCGWDEYNAQLVANWTNGKKGGRPKKPKKNPPKTHGLSMENPSETHREPIGEEERREEKIKHTHTAREQMVSHSEIVDEWRDDWIRWIDSWESRMGNRLDPIIAEVHLMQLAQEPPDKAAADLRFSLRKSSKSILDSSNDFSDRSRQPAREQF